tara:strand:+ start:1349 stop:2314 length:966 start_codon:yes stop_codon:yes gene_type:complete
MQQTLGNSINESNDVVFYQPQFRFLESSYLDAFISGQVYLSNILNFRKGDFGGLIDDEREGEISLHDFNHDANKRETIVYDPCIDEDIFVLCTTNNLVSESLFWALKEKRTSCCLIVRPNKLIDEISSNPELTFIGRKNCDYSGRDFYNIPSFCPWANQLPFRSWIHKYDALFNKPKNYANQLEHRVCWRASKKSRSHFELHTTIPSQIIRVDFEVEEKVALNIRPPLAVSLQIYGFDSKVIAEGSFQFSINLLSPLVYERKEDNKELLGFKQPQNPDGSNTLFNASIQGGDTGVFTHPAVGMLVLNIETKLIERIKYSVS